MTYHENVVAIQESEPFDCDNCGESSDMGVWCLTDEGFSSQIVWLCPRCMHLAKGQMR
jgi:hypothetical protein